MIKKLATIFLLIASIALLFGGSASAALSVNVTAVHTDGTPIKVTQPGTNGVIKVVASTNNETLKNPQALISTKPINGLIYNINAATMSVNGKKAISNSDPKFGNFLMWSDQDETWFWDISKITGSSLGPNNSVKLLIPVKVNTTGEITTDAIFEGSIMDEDNPVPAEQSYTFLSTTNPTPTVNAANTDNTIPMQKTGVPIALAALGLLSIVGGTLYSRRR